MPKDGDKIVRHWRKLCIANWLLAVRYQPDIIGWQDWIRANRN